MSHCVNLGLSVNWAACNLGASRIKESGDYFSWGEICTKTVFNLPSYRFKSDAGSLLPIDDLDSDYWNDDYRDVFFYTKYNAQDGKRVLDLEDDVARVVLGSNWRIPTLEEWQELIDSCDWTWIADEEGYQVRSRINRNTIFLPSTGYHFLDEFDVFAGLEDALVGIGSGAYGTTELYPTKLLQSQQSGSYTDAEVFFFDNNCKCFKHFDRAVGVAIRPVYRLSE